MWNGHDYLSYDYPLGRAVRVGEYLAYQNDAQFAREVTCYARKALEQVMYYRKHTPDERKTQKLLGDTEILEKIRQTRAFWRSKPSMKRMKYFEEYDILSETCPDGGTK